MIVMIQIFSFLLYYQNSVILHTLLDDDYNFIAPNFILTEIFNHKEKITKHSKLSANELLELLNNLFSRIQFVTPDFISLSNFSKAINLCKDVDEKDTIFVALTIELNAELWTGDKRLKDGLKAKGFDQFFLLKSK